MNEKAIKLSFMYDRFYSVGKYFLKFWVDDAEFQDEILSAMSQSIIVDERFVLKVMRTLYNKRMLAIQNGEKIVFNHKLAIRAIKKLEGQITNIFPSSK